MPNTTVKGTWLFVSVLLALMSAFTLYTLFVNSFGMTVISDLDSAQPLVVEKGLHVPRRDLETISTDDALSEGVSIPSIIQSIPATDTHKEFTFYVGMDQIQQIYNQSLSQIEPILNSKSIQNDRCDHKGRVFVLGIMKTGTTSMTKALASLGYKCSSDSCIHLGNWWHFVDTTHLWQPLEVIVLSMLNMTDLLEDQYLRETQRALAFGDSPWCFLYPLWDRWYPDSKYILMTRKDDNTYVNSYVKYLKKYGKKYANKGLSDEEFGLIALRRYHVHNQMVREYFKDRPDDLLEIGMGTGEDVWGKMTSFLGCSKPPKRGFPHENKSGGRSKKGKHVPVNVNVNDSAWDWRLKWGDNIPFMTRNPDKSHQIRVKSRREFVFDWNSFIVDELKPDE